MDYTFSENRFRKNFNVKKEEKKRSPDSLQMSHHPDHAFKLFPYKTSGKSKSPIVVNMEEVVSGFFRQTLRLEANIIQADQLCKAIIQDIDIHDEDIAFFRDMIINIFFREGNFTARNIGLYPYQTIVDNRSAERVAYFIVCIMKMDVHEQKKILDVIRKHPYNVLEKLVVDHIESRKLKDEENEMPYYSIITDVQEKFKKDFFFMIETGLSSLEDLSHLLALYYFYYMAQTCIVLDQFGQGKRNDPVPLYFALDWEKVSKNRLCCVEGWANLQANINHMFSHAITLEIINQHEHHHLMLDYIDFKEMAENDPKMDRKIACEIKRAENLYCSCVGDYKNFDQIPYVEGGLQTDRAIRHLFKCVEEQFLNTERKRANQSYNQKFLDFCKERWLKNRRKSGWVLNLTERDIIFLTKISIQHRERIRLIDLFKEYEYRGIYLDRTSKELLQNFFTKLNLIDKKSDSGDAQYVKRIL